MVLSQRRKLIEVSLPLEAINRASAREKSIRHGHPSTLHLWWARRPLAACRAVLFAQLVDDPSSYAEELADPSPVGVEAERARLHKIIEDMVPWEASTSPQRLHPARLEIARSVARAKGLTLPAAWTSVRHEADVIAFLQENAPLVHDPFCGGGSIPLEAQRLGLQARGSDLNPVAVLISKALIEFPPRFANRPPVNPAHDAHGDWRGARGLADDVRHYGRWMREQAAARIGHLYPKATLPDGGEATVIAWLWARTVPSPDPRARGAAVPLASSFVLSARAGREAIAVPVVDRAAMTWRFEVKTDPTREELAAAKNGTKSARGANFVCVLTGSPIDGDHVKAAMMAGQGGARLMAVVAEGRGNRLYLSPTQVHEAAAAVERPEVPELAQPLPDDPRNFWTTAYGLDSFDKLFTPRQLVALTTFSDLVAEARAAVAADAASAWGANPDSRALAEGGSGPEAYADAVATFLGFVVSGLADRVSSICTWDAGGATWGTKVRNTFARQALPMTWDFAEVNAFSDSSGSFENSLWYSSGSLEHLSAIGTSEAQLSNAASNHFAPRTLFSTDPPYYDNIGYADLSDYFYVWLRRSLGSVHPALFRRVVTPKAEELVATPYRHGGRDAAERHFLDGMRQAIAGMARASDDLPVTIYYAFKQTELSTEGVTSAGWATFLQAVFDCGFMVDGTWPVRSELSNRMIASGTNALASSIVLVCRCRPADAPSTTRPEFLRVLRRELPAAIATIRAGGVGPTDIQQAAIGPGIGIFTRHAAVLNPDGSALSVKDALKLINQVREEIASGDDADYDAATRFALDWFAGHGWGEGASGTAITMANALGLALEDLQAAGVAVARGGRTRVLGLADMAPDWDPVRDRTPTAWEACHHLVRRLTAEDGGIDTAARLMARLGALAEPARSLAMRLYDLAEARSLAGDAHGYKTLYDDWPEIEARATELATGPMAGDLINPQGSLL